MCAPFWMHARWNKCACVFFSERVSRHVITSLTFSHCHARSQLQSAVLPSNPEACGFSCFFELWLCGAVKQYCWEKHQMLREGASLEWHTCPSSHLHRHILWSFFSESLCRFWARNGSLFEVSVSVLMPSFLGVQGWSWASQDDEISEGQTWNALSLYPCSWASRVCVFQPCSEVMMARKFILF